MSDDPKLGEEVFPQPAQLDAEGRAAQKRRNMWLGLALLGFVVLVGVTTAVRLSGADSGKAEFYYNMKGAAASEEAPALPPGMTPDQAAPPPNLTDEPVVEEDVIIEEKAPE